jgi:transcriptional regulator with XRE-family HTH domain
MNGRALVAWNLRRLRSEQDISQEKLAADTGIDRAYVSEVERGLANVTVDLLDRMALHLGVGIDELFKTPIEGAPPQPLKPGRRSTRNL